MGRFNGNKSEVSTEGYQAPSLSSDQFTLLEKLHDELWFMRKDLNSSQLETMDTLVALELAYVPKVIDLEQETPDYGITDKGKAAWFTLSLTNGFVALTK